jgi:hypothetical protein
MDTTWCPEKQIGLLFVVRIFASTGKTKMKPKASKSSLLMLYDFLILSLWSLGLIREKGKLKDQIAWIEEVYSPEWNGALALDLDSWGKNRANPCSA